jgi:hypothetical protein
MKVHQISTTVEIDDLERAITASAEATSDALCKLLKVGSGIHFLAQLKFEKAGRDPLFGRPELHRTDQPDVHLPRIL